MRSSFFCCSLRLLLSSLTMSKIGLGAPGQGLLTRAPDPAIEAVTRLFALRRPRDEAGLVPESGAAVLRERQAVDGAAGLDANLGRFHLQTHPLAGLGQLAESQALRRLVFAPGNDVLAPVGAVQP